jgi:hypothetical protein
LEPSVPRRQTTLRDCSASPRRYVPLSSTLSAFSPRQVHRPIAPFTLKARAELRDGTPWRFRKAVDAVATPNFRT